MRARNNNNANANVVYRVIETDDPRMKASTSITDLMALNNLGASKQL